MESGRIFFGASASSGNNMLFLGNTELAFRGHSLSISLSVDFFLILLGFLLPFFVFVFGPFHLFVDGCNIISLVI